MMKPEICTDRFIISRLRVNGTSQDGESQYIKFMEVIMRDLLQKILANVVWGDDGQLDVKATMKKIDEEASSKINGRKG